MFPGEDDGNELTMIAEQEQRKRGKRTDSVWIRVAEDGELVVVGKGARLSEHLRRRLVQKGCVVQRLHVDEVEDVVPRARGRPVISDSGQVKREQELTC